VLKLKGVTVAKDDDLSMDEKLMSRFLGDLLPYFSSDIIFDQTNVRNALGDQALDWKMGKEGLVVMMKTFLRDNFPNVDWVQELTAVD
jgi:hypothetical protein